MTQNNHQPLALEESSSKEPPSNQPSLAKSQHRDWIGWKRVTLIGVLGSLLPLTITGILGLWGSWQTENNTMISREQDIEKDYQAQDAQNARLVAAYYESMTKFVEKEENLKNDRMQEVMKARTLSVFSQLSNDLSEDQNDQISKTDQKPDSIEQLKVAQPAKNSQQFQGGRKSPSAKAEALGQKCSISNRASVPAWKLLFGGAGDSLKQIEACAQQRQLEKNSVRKGEILRFLYDADLIGTCPSPTGKTINKRCIVSVFELTGAKLNSAESEIELILPGVNLRRANLSQAKLPKIELSRADLNYAKLNNADLQGALLAEAKMLAANLEGINLSGAYMEGVNLTDANLKQAKLGKAILSQASLCGADLRGTDLSSATLDGANLELAKYTPETKWPPGFNPSHKGLVPFDNLNSDYSKVQRKLIDSRCDKSRKLAA